MINKIIKFFLYILFIITIYIIQILILNDITLFGVTSNLILVSVAIVALNNNIYVSATFAFLCGIISDVFFTLSIGKFIIIYLILAIIINGISKIYKKESSGVIIYITVISTLLLEIFMSVINFANNKELVNIFSFILMVLKETILNIGLAYIVQVIAKRLKVKSKENLID